MVKYELKQFDNSNGSRQIVKVKPATEGEWDRFADLAKKIVTTPKKAVDRAGADA